jgi:succinate-acetate transporter protein
MGAGGLLVLTLTVTFAAFDWMMSLDPQMAVKHLRSDGWVGMMLSAFAFVTAVSSVVTPDQGLAGSLSGDG